MLDSLRRSCLLGALLGLGLLLGSPLALAQPQLSPDLLAQLNQGEIVVVDSDGASAGMASQAWARVNASPDQIWPLVSDPAHLKASASGVKQLLVNGDRTLASGKREQRLGYVLKVGFSDIRYNVIRVYDYDADRMSWTLDDSYDNDIVATNGIFALYPQPDGSTLFQYAITVDSGRSVPDWIQDHLTTSGIKRFLRYVQEQAGS